MKILIVSPTKLTDQKSWSGTSYSIFQTIKKNGNIVKSYTPSPKFFHILSKICFKLFGKKVDLYRTFLYSKLVSIKIERVISKYSPDLVLGITSSVEFAFIHCKAPIIYISDATFTAMLDYYFSSKSDFLFFKKQAITIESITHANARRILYPSEWSARSAHIDYNCPNSKINIIPFGANMPHAPHISKKTPSRQNCHFLFVGEDWYRKGGDIFIQTLNILREKGLNVSASVIGVSADCHPQSSEEWIEFYGVISKSTPEGMAKIQAEYEKAHILFVPSKAEAYGIIFAEAAMYAIPSISRKTGGIPSVIKNGETGLLLSYNASPKEYSNAILELIDNTDRYQQLSTAARLDYEQRLNWDKWYQSFYRSIQDELISRARSEPHK